MVARLITGTCCVRFGGVALEAGVLPQESETDRSLGTIALFADDDFGDALVGAIGVIDFVAVDKADQIRILFNRA